MKLGILGGTFDPVHKAHIVIAEEVKAKLILDEILFVPAGKPWLKAPLTVSPAEHRLAMLELALAGKHRLTISPAEIKREGPTYTVDTIAGLRREMGEGAELNFIMGWDSLLQLPLWRDPQRLISLCYIVAVHRPGVPRPDLQALDARIKGLSGRVIILDSPSIDISATEVRDRVQKRLSIHHLVPAPVEAYIKEHGLYASG